MWRLIGAFFLASAATLALLAVFGGLQITGFGFVLIGILCFAGVIFTR